jgi:RimJ/RimL family protein N-acetyltransferase
MHILNPTQADSKMRAWFHADEPAGVRAEAALEGNMSGRIFTDDPTNPTWTILQETAYGTLYLVGAVTTALLAPLIADLRRESEVMVGFWPGDSRIELFLPLEPEYDGRVYDFFDRPSGQRLDAYLGSVPEGCHIRPVDAELFTRLADYDTNAGTENIEIALQTGLGFCLMRDDEILCEALAKQLTSQIMEMGVLTHKPHEGKGYGTLTCAYLAQACEAKGFQTYWNCNGQNVGSLAIARKLGYRTEKPYRLLYWSKIEG